MHRDLALAVIHRDFSNLLRQISFKSVRQMARCCVARHVVERGLSGSHGPHLSAHRRLVVKEFDEKARADCSPLPARILVTHVGYVLHDAMVLELGTGQHCLAFGASALASVKEDVLEQALGRFVTK